MLCPIDDAELKASNFGGYEIHRCPLCLGALVNGNLLRNVHAHVALELHKQQATTAGLRPCPKDGAAMKSLAYKGVPLCACPQCLVLWLEAGKLSLLLELAGPPRQSDLSIIGRSLQDLPGQRTAITLEDVGDILDFSADALRLVDKLLD